MDSGYDGYRVGQLRVRRRFLLAGLLLLALFLGFLSLGTTSLRLISPVQTARNLLLGIRLTLAEHLKWGVYSQRLTLIENAPAYWETMTRLQSGLLVTALGAALAVSGAVFQCAFRNPIAGPSLLGVSSGISIGNLLLVLQFSSSAANMTVRRFAYGYGCSVALLALIFAVGWLAGRGKGSVTGMLLTGCVVSRAVSKAVSSAQYYWLDETDYLVLQEMSLYGTGTGNTRGTLFLLGALLLGLVPLLVFRGGLNALAFSDEEARTMGVEAGRLRVPALVCSTILFIAAQIHCGEVGMLAMLVPHLCRYVFGPDTRQLVAGSMLAGALLLLACQTVTALCAFHPVLWVVSLNTLVSVFAMPLMIGVMLKYRRGWS